MTTNTKAPAGWYAIFPDGSAWVAVKIDHRGDMVAMIEESQADTHMAVGDRKARICEAIRDSETDANVVPEIAAAVLAEWDADALPENCVVERIVPSPHGDLCDYDTGDVIRPATAEERAASLESAEHGTGAGAIDVDGRSCYVQD